jgi:hypothetical protein
MKNEKKLIFIQLNEINFDILKKYSSKSRFKFFNSSFFDNLKKTHSEQDYDLLEPWIQWVSVHTGKSAKEHNIFRLGDIKNFSYEQIFEKIEKKGKSVGAITPMNVKNNLLNPEYFISDPWTNTISGPSSWIRFVAKNLAKIVNLNANKKIPIKIYINILIILIRSFRFFNFKIYLDLLTKSFVKKWNKALILDLLLHDIHINFLKKKTVDFSTIFFNAGAHIQHHYFFNSVFVKKESILRNPNWYIKDKYDPFEEMVLFYDHILYEYSLLKDYEIILSTGLSQKPYDRLKYYYRLVNHKNFLKTIQVNFSEVEPRMTRDFLISFFNIKDLEDAVNKFDVINSLNNNKIFSYDKRDKSLFVSLIIPFEINKNCIIYINKEKSILMKNHVTFVALKNGMHSSEGYIFASWKNNIYHIKDIFNEIDNFFKADIKSN